MCEFSLVNEKEVNVNVILSGQEARDFSKKGFSFILPTFQILDRQELAITAQI